MALRIRRGTDAQRSGVTFEMGEIVWTTDGQQLFVGDGLAQGGTAVIGAQILGYGLAYDSLNKRIEVAGLTSDDVAEGSNRLYHTTERAVDAVGAALVAGNSTNVGITFIYSQTQDDAGRINATVALDGVGITEVAADTSPSLGGNLDLDENNITGLGSIDITGNVTASGIVGNDVITINAGVITSTSSLGIGITNSDTRLDIGSVANPNTLWVTSRKLFTVSTGLTDGTLTSGHSTRISRGTLAVPTAVQPNDIIAYYEGAGYDGTEYIQAGAFGLVVDPTGTVTTGNIPAVFGALLPAASGGGITSFLFNNKGTLSAPVIQTGSYDSTQRNTLTPLVGMIIYNTTSNKFQGYQNTGGTTLEWVDLS
jgi:Major tropism determinant N-terminal domain